MLDRSDVCVLHRIDMVVCWTRIEREVEQVGRHDSLWDGIETEVGRSVGCAQLNGACEVQRRTPSGRYKLCV